MSCDDPKRCPRARLIRDDRLIDLDEWAGLHGHPNPFPVPSGITVELWKRISTIPFKLAGKVTAEDRLCEVLRRAQQCLEQRHPDYAHEQTPDGVRLAFAAPVPSSANAHGHTPLSLYCGPCGCRRRVVTIGLPTELSADSRDPASARSGAPTPALQAYRPRTGVERSILTHLRLYTEL